MILFFNNMQLYNWVSKHGAKLLLFHELTKFCTWENDKHNTLLFSTLHFINLGFLLFTFKSTHFLLKKTQKRVALERNSFLILSRIYNRW